MIPLGGGIPSDEASVAAGEGAVWVVAGTTRRSLLDIDPTTQAVVATFDFPSTSMPTAVRAGLGGVWVVSPTQDQLLRFDPKTLAQVATIRVPGRPTFLAIGAGSVWVMAHDAGTVSRIDPSTSTVTATIDLGGPIAEGQGDIAVGGGFVWVRGDQTFAWKIDPASNAVVAVYTYKPGSGSIAADDDAVWISTEGPQTLFRLPLR
jgi:YVTN family beta-propeller protein